MWIELQQSLWTHRKTFALAEALAIDEVHAGGLVARLWCWALDNAQADYDHRRGLLTGVVPRAIAGGAGWKGDACYFFEALINAGFLDHDGDDIVIHDWWDYSGRLLERRRKDRDRKREAAAKAGKKPRSRSKAIPQETARTSHLTHAKPAQENIVTVPTLLTESLNHTELTPPTPPLDARGECAREQEPTALRILKPWERDLVEAERDPLFAPLVEIDGRPVTRGAVARACDHLRALDDLGAAPDELRQRAANYRLIMSPGIPLTMRALIDNWERCALPPAPEPVDAEAAQADSYAAWGRALNERRREIHERDEVVEQIAVAPYGAIPALASDEIEYVAPARAAPGQYAHPLALGGRRGKPGEIRYEPGQRWEYEPEAPGWRRLD